MAKPIYSEEKILEVARITIKNARLHLDALGEFGVDETMLTDLEKAITEAESWPRIISNRKKLKSKTNTKQNVLQRCYRFVGKVKARFEMAYGKKSPEAINFPGKQLREAKNNELEMLAIFEAILEMAQNHREKLAVFGMTDKVFAQGKELNQQLRNASVDQKATQSENLAATQTRHQKFEAIYNTTLQIQKAGQEVFKEDPVKLAFFKKLWQLRYSRKKSESEPEPQPNPETPTPTN